MPTTAAGEGAIYTKDTNSRPTLFYRQESDGTEIQMTGPDPVLTTAGLTFLPGGILMQWGKDVSIGTLGTITFPTAFSTLYSLSFGGSANVSYTGTPSGTSFSFSKTGGKHFFWTAIGAI